MTAPGTRLAVVDHTGVCDGPGQHDLRVITDGQVFYAYGLSPSGSDCPSASRTRWGVEVTCAQPASYREECEGHLRVTLSDEGAWSSAPEALGLLDQYGQQVDR